MDKLYQLYLSEMENLTEHEFALKHFGNWDTWQQKCDSGEFKPIIEKWRKELQAKIQGRALRAIIEEAESGSKNSFQANKYLLEKFSTVSKRDDEKTDLPKEEKRPVGRPNKIDTVKIQAERDFSDERLLEDFERITSSEARYFDRSVN